MNDNKRFIGLITDFGSKDFYVGVIKAVIKNINSKVEIITVTNGLSPHYKPSASFVIEKTYKYFPPLTVFLIVVDPEVGTNRKILLVNYDNKYFIGPDNGVLTPILNKKESTARIIDAEHYFLDSNKSTFEARDKMAPVAAYLSNGIEDFKFGTETSNYILDKKYYPTIKPPNTINGKIIYVDRFGNIVTNIPGETIFKNLSDSPYSKFKVNIEDNEIIEFYKSYKQGKKTPFMIIGSHGNLEISMYRKPAYKKLNAKLNKKISLTFY